MTLQVYKMKGPGHKDREIRHFAILLSSLRSHSDARLYSIDYLQWEDFAELKGITVSINRFMFLPF